MKNSYSKREVDEQKSLEIVKIQRKLLYVIEKYGKNYASGMILGRCYRIRE